MKIRSAVGTAARAVVCTTLLSLAPAAFAHYLWIERDGERVRVYFGEVNEVREQSPGRLDEIVGPRLVTVTGEGAERELALERRRGSFAAAGASHAGNLVATEARYAVKDWSRQGIGVVKPMFYARTSEWPARSSLPNTAAMRLDVRPAPGKSEAVEVLFDGKPLAGAKVVVHAPNGWDREEKADEQGLALTAMPWRGHYVVEVIHKEVAAGEFEGKRFEAVRHRATLSVIKRSGVNPAGTGSLAPKVAD